MNLAARERGHECGASDFQKVCPAELAVITDEVNNDSDPNPLNASSTLETKMISLF